MTEQNPEIRMQQLESKVQKMQSVIVELQNKNEKLEKAIISCSQKDDAYDVSQFDRITELETRFKNHINNESHKP